MSYVFDANTDPNERTRRRRLAEALMLKATDAGPIASPWQGAAKMAQALMGGIELGQYDKQDRLGQESAKADMEAAMNGGGVTARPQVPSPVAAALANPPSFTQTGGKMAQAPSDLAPYFDEASKMTGIPASVLMAKVQQHYGLKLKFFYPNHAAIESFTREHGINAFYDSVELRKACCHARKVEPLGRALAGKQAWITGLRAQQSTTRTDLPKREFDAGNGLVKFNPLSDWSEKEVWAYIRLHQVPYNALHDKFYPSIGCAPCTRPVSLGEDIRAGRWWWENPETKECGLHVKK